MILAASARPGSPVHDSAPPVGWSACRRGRFSAGSATRMATTSDVARDIAPAMRSARARKRRCSPC